MRTIQKYAVAGAAAIALAFAAGAAQARPHGGHFGGHAHFGHHGHFGGGFGPGFVGGLALGAVASGPYYGYDYGPYAYDYGPDCYIRRTVVVNRWGHRIVRRIRVCD